MSKILVLDPGHGGSDPGAVGNGLKEKDITLVISRKIREILEGYEGIEIRLTRETDKYLSLKERTDMANKWEADYVLSIHINAGGGTGFESFIWNGKVDNPTVSAQNVIHTEVIKLIDAKDRGKKRANFHMLRETKMPALLTENLFIDNPGDAAKLKDKMFLDRIAQGHANGIVAFFGLKKKQPPIPVAEHKTEQAKPGDYAGHWAEKYIDRVIQEGLMIGDDKGNFAPDKPVSRAELAVVLNRILERNGLK